MEIWRNGQLFDTGHQVTASDMFEMSLLYGFPMVFKGVPQFAPRYPDAYYYIEAEMLEVGDEFHITYISHKAFAESMRRHWRNYVGYTDERYKRLDNEADTMLDNLFIGCEDENSFPHQKMEELAYRERDEHFASLTPPEIIIHYWWIENKIVTAPT